MSQVSISPRETSKFTAVVDVKHFEETEKYRQNQEISISKLTFLLRSAVLEKKPENILNFIIDDFFSPENIVRLKQRIQEYQRGFS